MKSNDNVSTLETENEESDIGQGPPKGFGQSVNEYYNHYISVADTKAGAFLAGNLVILGLMVDQAYLATMASWTQYISIGFLAISSVLAALVLFPRLPRGKQEIIFWEDVYSFPSLLEYQNDLRRVSEQDVEMKYATQNYLVSGVLHRKHQLLRWSIGFSLLGVTGSFVAYWLALYFL